MLGGGRGGLVFVVSKYEWDSESIKKINAISRVVKGGLSVFLCVWKIDSIPQIESERSIRSKSTITPCSDAHDQEEFFFSIKSTFCRIRIWIMISFFNSLLVYYNNIIHDGSIKPQTTFVNCLPSKCSEFKTSFFVIDIMHSTNIYNRSIKESEVVWPA